jgi:hypothetical protein
VDGYRERELGLGCEDGEEEKEETVIDMYDIVSSEISKLVLLWCLYNVLLTRGALCVFAVDYCHPF